jgi:hypothetical protein
MKIEVDLDILDDIQDDDIKNILRRFAIDGYADFHNNTINRKVSRAVPHLVDGNNPVLVFSNSRRANIQSMSVNNNVFNAEKIVSMYWKDIIKELR